MPAHDLIQIEAKKFFQGAKGSHDWEHTERVVALARHLARVEQADPEIVHCAALLHDIARGDEDQQLGQLDHAAAGALRAGALLRRHGMAPARIAHITHCILTHRFRNNHEPQTLEARVLFDADKLDCIGAVGIGRAFLFAGEIGAKLHNPTVKPEHSQPYSQDDTAYREFQVKLRQVKERMLTREGRRLAEARHAFMVSFFERLNREAGGLE